LLTADLNGDGILDLAVASTAGSVSILMGKGDGTFNSAVDYSTGGFSAAVAAADFNGDGILDLVFTNYYTSNISLLLGRGDCTFGAFTTYPADYGARGLVVADFNGDGRLDLAVGNQFVDSISVFFGASSNLSTTSTTFASSVTSSVYGQIITFSAEVSSASGTPTGTVIFYDGSISIGSATLTSGTAAIPVSSLSAGTHSITAAYQGSATFSGSTSAPVSQVVNAASTATTLSSSLNPAGTNQSVTFGATVTSHYGGAATGSVVFSSGSQTLGTASLSGNTASLTTSFPTRGTYSISAKYNGDGNNAGSTSSTLSQTIIASTTTTLVSSLNPSVVGQVVTFTATVSSSFRRYSQRRDHHLQERPNCSSHGPAQRRDRLADDIFFLDGWHLHHHRQLLRRCQLRGQYFARTPPSGELHHQIRDCNHSCLEPEPQYLRSVRDLDGDGDNVRIRPTDGKSEFHVEHLHHRFGHLDRSGVATLTKSNLNADNYPLTAVYIGDASNLGSTSPVLKQVVTQATSSATLTSLPNPSTSGQAATFTATITSPTAKPAGPVTFAVGKTVLGTAQLSGGKAKFTTTTLAGGTSKVTATYGANSNIAGSSASVTQTVH
jgi:Bacterial Ig-like domain (group 3)/FG-GAP-like repeat/FG-GAP repeat